MRIGLLVTSIGNFGQKGFYNTQEIGLAKALARLCDGVTVYKLVADGAERKETPIEGYPNASILFLPAKRLGNNGILDVSVLDETLDALICFADTQLAIPRVGWWARKHGVTLFPYIGVLESHSTNRLIKKAIDAQLFRNLRVYRRCHCFAKTPEIADKLQRSGIEKVTVMPVGLDSDLLKRDYKEASAEVLKQKYSYAPEDKILLFVGRLTEEKRPLETVELFLRLAHQDDSFHLLMVGSGELDAAVEDAVARHGLTGRVRRLERIANSEIWELYRIAWAFVNLNRQEIFGMAILEAMYYGCKVVAWRAPGPDCIIENGISGWLVQNTEQALERIIDSTDLSDSAHERVQAAFMWDNTAKRMMEVIDSFG